MALRVVSGIFLLLVGLDCFSQANSQPCDQSITCGKLVHLEVGENAVPHLMEFLFDQALSNPEVISFIQKPLETPPSLSSPDLKECPKSLSLDECLNICDSEKLNELDRSVATKVCPQSIPKMIFDETALNEINHIIPVNLDGDNANISKIKFGASQVTRIDSNNLKTCLPIEEFKLTTDLKVTRHSNQEELLGLKGLNIETNQPLEVCFNIELVNGSHAKILSITPPPIDDKQTYRQIMLMSEQQIDAMTDEDLTNAQEIIAVGLPEVGQIQSPTELRKKFKELRKDYQHRSLIQIPEGSLNLGALFEEEELSLVQNKVIEELYKKKNPSTSKNFAQMEDEVLSSFSDYQEDFEEALIKVLTQDPDLSRFSNANSARIYLFSKDLVNDFILKEPYFLHQIEWLFTNQIAPPITERINELVEQAQLSETILNTQSFQVNRPLISVQDTLDKPKLIKQLGLNSDSNGGIYPEMQFLKETLLNIPPNPPESFDVTNSKFPLMVENFIHSISSTTMSAEVNQVVENLKENLKTLLDLLQKTKQAHPNLNTQVVTEKGQAVGPRETIDLPDKTKSMESLLLQLISDLEDKSTEITNNIIQREKSLNIRTSFSFLDNISNGFNLEVAIDELCEDKAPDIAINHPQGNAQRSSDIALDINVDALNEILFQLHEQGDLDICYDYNDFLTCSHNRVFSNGFSCNFLKAPHLSWKDGSHYLNMPNIRCDHSIAGMKFLGKILLNEHLGGTLKVDPRICEDGKLCLSPKLQTYSNLVNLDNPLSLATSLIKTGTLVTPIVIGSFLGPFIGGSAGEALSPFPGLKVTNFEQSPGVITIHGQFRGDSTLAAPLNHQISSALNSGNEE